MMSGSFVKKNLSARVSAKTRHRQPDPAAPGGGASVSFRYGTKASQTNYFDTPKIQRVALFSLIYFPARILIRNKDKIPR